MNPPSALCRAQEAFHRDRADRTELENVRRIATAAANAWGVQASAAERREARTIDNRLHALERRQADGDRGPPT